MKIRIAAALAATLLLAGAQSAMADEYAPCRHPGEDHCRVVAGGHWNGHGHRMMHDRRHHHGRPMMGHHGGHMRHHHHHHR